MLVGDVGDPYFDAMIDGVHRVAAEESCLVTIINTGRDPERELEAFRQLQSLRTSIVIVAGSGITDPDYTTGLTSRIQSFNEAGRVVLLGRHEVDADLDVIHVEADNVDAGRALGAHLRELGHSKVGVLSGLQNVTSTVDRIAGITDGLGHEPVIKTVDPTRDGGYAGTRELMASEPDLTAIVGTADQMAMGAMAYFRDHGISVPHDVSVAGCNDIWVSRDLTPGLTTIHFPLFEIGAAALRLALVEGDHPKSQRFPVQLVVRGSTGPCPD